MLEVLGRMVRWEEDARNHWMEVLEMLRKRLEAAAAKKAIAAKVKTEEYERNAVGYGIASAE